MWRWAWIPLVFGLRFATVGPPEWKYGESGTAIVHTLGYAIVFGILLGWLISWFRARSPKVVARKLARFFRKEYKDARKALVIGLRLEAQARANISRSPRSKAIANFAADTLIYKATDEPMPREDRDLAVGIAGHASEDDRRLAAQAAWALAQAVLYAKYDVAKNSIDPAVGELVTRLGLRSVKLNPISPYFATLAQLYLSTNNPHEAYRTATRAIEIDPKNGEAMRLKGNAAAAIGNTDEARTLYASAIVLSGNNDVTVKAAQSAMNQLAREAVV